MKDTAEPHARPWPLSALQELIHRPPKQLAALDGLRAIAVLLVIFGHWVYEWTTFGHFPEPRMARLPMFYWGWTGVDLFFVLSGFLIGKQLWGELKRTGGVQVGTFVLRRGLRIWPLYYSWLLFLVAVGNEKSPSWPDVVMLSNMVASRYNRGWSLSSEEQFYLLMPVFLLVLRRFVAPRWWPGSLLGIMGLVALGRGLTYQSLIAQGVAPADASTMLYAPLYFHCEPLLAGMLVAWIVTYRPAVLAPREPGGLAVPVIAGAAVVAATGIALRVVNREAFAYVALAGFYGSALAVALADRSWLTAVLRWGGWYPIARLSFGMYLNHMILRYPTEVILSIGTRLFGPGTIPAFLCGLVLSVAASAVMAAISFVAIEQPGLALRDRWFERRAALATARGAASVT